MIKELDEIRLKKINGYQYEVSFHNPDGQKAQSVMLVKEYEVGLLNNQLKKLNKKIKEANLNSKQGSLL